jgi:hypothetical protein
MFPGVYLEENTAVDERSEKEIGKTYLFDFETGEFILQDGKLVVASRLEAVELWIKKIIRTEKFKFKIYEKSEEERNEEYGITFKSLIGKKLPQEMIKSEIKRELTEVLTKHPVIEKLSSFSVIQEGLKVTISFTVHLIDDEITFEEVI